MASIEIWKSTPAWQTLSADEKQLFALGLRYLLRERQPNADGEPYIISKKEGALLFWTWHRAENKSPALSPSDFRDYFELLCTVAVTETMNAKKLVQKLSQ